jgi:hypothetical protein
MQGKPQKTRIPVQITAGPFAVWVICNDGTIWHTNTDRSGRTAWNQAPEIPQS